MAIYGSATYGSATYGASSTSIQHRITSTGTKANGAGSTLTVPIHASVEVGDLLVAGIMTTNNARTISTPSGWTQVASQGSGFGGSIEIKMAYRIAQLGDAGTSTLWTLDSGSTIAMAGAINAYYDTSGGDWAVPPLHVFGTAERAVSGTTIATASITTTINNALLVAAIGANLSDQTSTPPATLTERADLSSGAGLISMADMIQSSMGSVDAQIFTLSSAATYASSIIAAFELIPVPQAIEILPSAISPSENLSSPIVTVGSVNLLAGSIVSEEETSSVGVLSVTNVTPETILSEELFSNAVIEPLAVVLLPTNITTEEDVSIPTVLRGEGSLSAAGIPSQAAFGMPVLFTGPIILLPESLTTQENVSEPLVLTEVFVNAGEIISEEAVSELVMIPQSVALSIFGIYSEEQVSVPSILSGETETLPQSVLSEEEVSEVIISSDVVIIEVFSVSSQETITGPSITVVSASEIISTEISSEENFGFIWIGQHSPVQATAISSAEEFGILRTKIAYIPVYIRTTIRPQVKMDIRIKS